MLYKLKKVYRGVTDATAILARMSEISKKLDMLENAVRHETLSPIDRHVFLSHFYSNKGLFHYSYENWRIQRINKILEFYGGVEYFKNKRILELGSGHAEIGAFFADLGAEVLCLDGRMENVVFANLKHRKVKNFKCLQFDLENDFSHFGKFDLIINLGLLYHLKNVDSHLNCCFAMGDEIVFESVVCDSTDPQKIIFCQEDKTVNEEALNGTGSRPSPFYIERVAKQNNFDVIRCFSKDLNTGNQFCYDWEHKNDGSVTDNLSLRRFWRFSRKMNGAVHKQ